MPSIAISCLAKLIWQAYSERKWIYHCFCGHDRWDRLVMRQGGPNPKRKADGPKCTAIRRKILWQQFWNLFLTFLGCCHIFKRVSSKGLLQILSWDGIWKKAFEGPTTMYIWQLWRFHIHRIRWAFCVERDFKLHARMIRNMSDSVFLAYFGCWKSQLQRKQLHYYYYTQQLLGGE